MRISEVTRRAIIDTLIEDNVDWSGRFEEPEFLARLYPLEDLPDTNGRFRTAADDIWQHRISNVDWEDDWVFTDNRFKLLHGEDEVFLRFLCEMIHPVVRPDVEESRRLQEMFNTHLLEDGYRIVEKTQISGRPVFAAQRAAICSPNAATAARDSLKELSGSYLSQQLTRIEAAIEDDPDLAIGTAKELIETICKSILEKRGEEVPSSIDLPKLVRLASKTLKLTPADISDEARAVETIRRLLNSLATITQGMAELRNQYGTGHGRTATSRGLQPRHAKLAVGAATALAVFLWETHEANLTSGQEPSGDSA
ncbi:MAG: abortive infection family protein [bacterium]